MEMIFYVHFKKWLFQFLDLLWETTFFLSVAFGERDISILRCELFVAVEEGVHGFNEVYLEKCSS